MLQVVELVLESTSAQGEAVKVNALAEQYEAIEVANNNLLIAFARAGLRQRANDTAVEIDSVPFGYLKLIRLIHTCICGAPFDLEASPDFAKRVEDAGLPWPPLAPIVWPLKDY